MMSKNNKTPLAFPYSGEGDHTNYSTGMTLRDYFAAKAMQSLILDKHYQKLSKDSPADMHELFESLAAESYDIADAMLKVRPTI